MRDTLRLPASLGLPLRNESHGLPGAHIKPTGEAFSSEVYRAGVALRRIELDELKVWAGQGALFFFFGSPLESS